MAFRAIQMTLIVAIPTLVITMGYLLDRPVSNHRHIESYWAPLLAFTCREWYWATRSNNDNFESPGGWLMRWT